MKKQANYIQLIVLIILSGSLLHLASCGEDDGLSDREVFIESITGTWVLDEDGYILIDNQDITDILSDFELTINNDLTYTTNSDQLILEEFPWPTTGSFMLNDELTQFIREDDLVITLKLSNSEMSLDLEFTADENTNGGRIKGIRGVWKVRLNKKS